MENINTERQEVVNKENHQWVTYSNPRNGRIRVIACKYCGVMKMGALASKPCSPNETQNSIESKGWTIHE